MTDMAAAAVYLLCLATSVVCALLLVRAFKRSSAPVLFWSALGFALLALNNLIVVLDMLVVDETDLMPARLLAAFASVAVLIYGFVWKVRL